MTPPTTILSVSLSMSEGNAMANNLVTQKIIGGWVGALLSPAIDGRGQLPGAVTSAVAQLGRSGDHEKAIRMLTTGHVAMAGGQGFVTNFGGFVALPVSLPANLTAVTLLNLRLAAAIAHLRGYDVSDDRVRTACTMCLLGSTTADETELPPIMAVATAPVVDRSLLTAVQARVSSVLIGRIGGKQLVTGMLKRIPLAGGVIGAGADGWTTWAVANTAKESFITRIRIG